MPSLEQTEDSEEVEDSAYSQHHLVRDRSTMIWESMRTHELITSYPKDISFPKFLTYCVRRKLTGKRMQSFHAYQHNFVQFPGTK